MDFLLALTLFILLFLSGGTLIIMGIGLIIYGLKNKHPISKLGIIFTIIGIPLFICSMMI